jgi:hypothetical protein
MAEQAGIARAPSAAWPMIVVRISVTSRVAQRRRSDPEVVETHPRAAAPVPGAQ